MFAGEAVRSASGNHNTGPAAASAQTSNFKYIAGIIIELVVAFYIIEC